MAHHKLNYLDGSIKSFLRIHGYHGKKRKPSEQATCVGQELRGRSTGGRKEQRNALAEAARKCANQKSPRV